MRIRWLAAMVVLLTGVGAAQAQPAKAVEPTIELRVRSVNELLTKADYVVGLIGVEEVTDVMKDVRKFVKDVSAEGKGVGGIDTKRPFGLHATLITDVTKSPVTLMIPIADQDAFLQLIADNLKLIPEKAEGGLLKVTTPSGEELYLRFTSGYLYVARSSKDLDPKTLVTPRAFFAGDDGAVASLIVHLDRLPEEFKKDALTAIEGWLAKLQKDEGLTDNPFGKVAAPWAIGGLQDGIKTLFEDTKDLKVRLVIDEKTDTLAAEVSLSAKPGSTLARNFASLGRNTSLPAGIVAAKGFVARASIKIAMTDGLQKGFPAVVDAAIVEALKEIPDEERDTVKSLLNSLAPTVKAAEVDVALALIGSEDGTRHTLIAALGVKKAKEVEKLMKLAVRFRKEPKEFADFAFDVEKIGEFNLHKITIKDFPPEAEKFFGSKTLWLAVSDDCIALSIEPDGMALRAGLKARPIPVPVLNVEVALARVVALVDENAQAGDLKDLIKNTFGKNGADGKDTIALTITGGDKLTVKAAVKGKAIRFGVGLVQLKLK